MSRPGASLESTKKVKLVGWTHIWRSYIKPWVVTTVQVSRVSSAQKKALQGWMFRLLRPCMAAINFKAMLASFFHRLVICRKPWVRMVREYTVMWKGLHQIVILLLSAEVILLDDFL